MKYWRKIIIAFVISLAFGIIDALFIAIFNSSISFGGALFKDASAFHIILRLVVFIGLVGYTSYSAYNDYQKDCQRLGIWREKPATLNDLKRRSANAKHKNNNNNNELNNCDNISNADPKSERLWLHAKKLANAIKLDAEQQKNLCALCYAYDIGHIAIVDSAAPYYLGSFASINPQEQKEEAHAELGARIISQIPEYSKAADLFRYHHEYWDGSGYLGLAGLEIPLGCRVFTIVWIFDALVYDNSQKYNYTTEEALEVLYHYKDTALDPDLTDVFIKIMTKNKLNFLGQSETVFN